MRSIASATAFDAGAALVAAATANNVAAARFLLEQAPQFSHKALLTAFGKSLKHADGNVVHAMLQYLRAAPVAEFLYIKALGFWVGGKGVIPSEEFSSVLMFILKSLADFESLRTRTPRTLRRWRLTSTTRWCKPRPTTHTLR
jgi:hypothetical protein